MLGERCLVPQRHRNHRSSINHRCPSSVGAESGQLVELIELVQGGGSQSCRAGKHRGNHLIAPTPSPWIANVYFDYTVFHFDYSTIHIDHTSSNWRLGDRETLRCASVLRVVGIGRSLCLPQTRLTGRCPRVAWHMAPSSSLRRFQ